MLMSYDKSLDLEKQLVHFKEFKLLKRGKLPDGTSCYTFQLPNYNYTY